MYYVVHYEVCAAVFMLLLIIVTALKKEFGNFQSKIYRAYLIITFASLCFDVITCYTVTYYEVVPLWLNYLLNSVFLVLQFIIPTMFMVYVHFNVAGVRNVNAFLWRLSFLPATIGVIHILLNVWTNQIFYFDHNGYQHGPSHDYLYINAAIYAVGTIWYMIRARRFLNRRQCMLIIGVVVVAMLPTLIQFWVPNYMLSGVGSALSVFTIYMMNENMTEFIDLTTGALNREALIFHMKASRAKRMPMQIFIIALDNFKLVNEAVGIEGGNQVMRTIVHNLQEYYSESAVFRFGGDNFVVVLEERTEGAKELDRIRKLVGKKYTIEEEIIDLSACVGLVHSIHHDEEDLFYAMEYAVSCAKQMGKGQFFEVDEKAVEDMSRKAAIEQALISAIESGHFEVHYQPIYDVKNRRFHSMEALARLRVEGYGYVSPEEFIRIAEQNGTIIQIGMLVLDEVCQFIRQYNLKRQGIDFVEVNLSTVQCMQETIYSDIMEILERYNVPPAMINLEITESAAAYSDDLLTRNMARISLTDITFSLDDYGSGYSNVNYLVDLPFSIVKIDKYLIWAAMKKVTSRKVLKNMIAMFKAIDLKVVAEGIEDMEMAEMVMNMGVDYLQGYHFSKPVPKDLLVERLSEEYLNRII